MAYKTSNTRQAQNEKYRINSIFALLILFHPCFFAFFRRAGVTNNTPARNEYKRILKIFHCFDSLVFTFKAIARIDFKASCVDFNERSPPSCKNSRKRQKSPKTAVQKFWGDFEKTNESSGLPKHKEYRRR